MRFFSRTPLVLLLCSTLVLSQTSQSQKRQTEVGPDDVVRITTQLVQTDVVVVDGKDRVIPDLTLADFELYDNGKKQELKFLEFVSVDTGRRAEGKRPASDVPAAAAFENETMAGVSAKELKRVIAFVVDDLTIPVQDVVRVRNLLLNFVNNDMLNGDLIAVVRVVGGKGLLQQFTSDRTLLREAIAAIKPISHPYSSVGGPDLKRIELPRQPGTVIESPVEDMEEVDRGETYSPTDEVNQWARGLSTLATANYVIESLKEIPGHKNMVIISGGIPIFQGVTGEPVFANITYLFQRLSDSALRAGVTLNAMDPRGLSATPGVVSFSETPGRSNYESELLGTRTGFGRGGIADQATLSPLLAGASERLGLNTIAKLTGGVSVSNTDEFASALEKILARSRGYYLLAYTPNEKFDRKYHKLEVKVKRSDARVFHHHGYAAIEDRSRAERTKEEQIVAAARSPVAKRDLEISPSIALKLSPETNKAACEVHILIDPKKLNFTHADNQYKTSLDIVGFVLDELGKQRGGFSESLNLNLSQENYERAKSGIIYTAAIDLPPGYFQLRAVVREHSSGALGTFSKYLEIPNLKRDSMALSSLFLFAVDGSQPTPLTAIRRVSRKQDLRYAVLIYNPKLKDGQPKLTSQLIISQGEKVLLRQPEEPVEPVGSNQHAKVGQFGVSKMQPGRYVLTVIVTDTLADKKRQTSSRSLDFTVVP